MNYISDLQPQKDVNVTVHGAPTWSDNNVSSSEFMSALKSLVNFSSPGDIAPEISTLSAGTTINNLGGVLAPNGIIYGIPYGNTSTILTINTNTTPATVGTLSAGTTINNYGGVLAPNGIIYGIPFANTSTILTINTLSGSIPSNIPLSRYLNKF